MNGVHVKQEELFGLFELDELGTVLYSRIEPEGGNSARASDLIGKDFFSEIGESVSATELRAQFANFTHGTGIADSFLLTYRQDGNTLPVKVLFARICEKQNPARTKSIMVHFKRMRPIAA
jgi:hypothetical protein